MSEVEILLDIYNAIADYWSFLYQISNTSVEIKELLELIYHVNFMGWGLMIGSQLWRNFILAKNQRHFL